MKILIFIKIISLNQPLYHVLDTYWTTKADQLVSLSITFLTLKFQAPCSFCDHTIWFVFDLVEYTKTNRFSRDESIRFKRPGCHMIRRPNYFDHRRSPKCIHYIITFKFQCPLKTRVICIVSLLHSAKCILEENHYSSTSTRV